MKPISYISYINEFIALILFILTLLEVIPNEVVLFYILWVMGLFMSIFAGVRDLGGDEKPKKPQEVFTPIIANLLYGLGVFQLGILIASFFPQIGNYTLLLIILFISIGAKWGLVHGYKLNSRKK